MPRQHEHSGGGPPKPPYLAAALAAGGVLLLYVLTLAPAPTWWDTSEYIATAHTLGLPHPPGNPLFVTVGRTWSLLLAPLGLPPAVRINLLAAATSAGASFFFFLIVHRALARLRGEGSEALVGAAVAVVVSATAFTVWSQSNTNEKVYTISLLIAAAVSWLMLRWYDRRDDPRSVALVVLAVYLMALGVTNHLMSALPAGAVLVFIVLTRPRLLAHGRFLSWCGAAVVVGLSFNFFLPIRAAQRPEINEGDPLCDGVVETAVAIYTNGAAGCPALASSLKREQYMKPPVTTRMAPFSHQLYNFWQYFDWQWARGVDPDEPPSDARARLPFSLLFLALGGVGLFTVWRGDRAGGAYLAVFAATVSVALVFYLNFRYGYSLAPEITGERTHEVRERDYFFLLFFALWGLMAGLGVARCWLWLGDRVGSLRKSVAGAGPGGDPVRPEPELGEQGGGLRGARLGLRPAQQPGAVRGDIHQRRQRHVPALVPAGGRGDSPGRDRGGGPVPVHGLVREAAQGTHRAGAATAVRSGGGPPVRRPRTPARTRPDAHRRTDRRDRRRAAARGHAGADGRHGATVSAGNGHSQGSPDRAGDDRRLVRGETDLLRVEGRRNGGVEAERLGRLRGSRRPSPHARPGRASSPRSIAGRPSRWGGEWFKYARSKELVDEVYGYRGLRNREIWPDFSTKGIVYGYYRLTVLLGALTEEEGDMETSLRYRRMADEFLQVYYGGTEARRAETMEGAGGSG